jgi:hypothetical protein
MTLITQTGDTMMSVPSFRRYLQLSRLHASTRALDLQAASSGRLGQGALSTPGRLLTVRMGAWPPRAVWERW